MKRTIVIIVASLVGLLAGCIIAYQLAAHPTKIGELKMHIEEYQGRRVKVNGKVLGGIAVSGYGGYLLEDETGKVLVKATAVPAKGAHITAEGRVEVPLQTPLGDVIVIDTTAK
jgi:hypothetical protein